MTISFLRLPDVMSRLGRSRSTLYEAIERGLFPPPIKLGRSARWRSDEVDHLIDAYTAGLSEDALTALCRTIVAQRAAASP